jgi:hypothetical protein
MTQILITHSPQDEDFARRLENSLTRMGARVRIDADYPPDEPGNDRTTRQRLRIYDALIVVMSPETAQSERIEREWRHMLHLQRAMIPVLWRDVPDDAALNRQEYVDFIRLDYDRALKELHLLLRRDDIKIYDPTAQIFDEPLSRSADDGNDQKKVTRSSRSSTGGNRWQHLHGTQSDDRDTSLYDRLNPGRGWGGIAVVIIFIGIVVPFVIDTSPSPDYSDYRLRLTALAEPNATLSDYDSLSTRLARVYEDSTATAIARTESAAGSKRADETAPVATASPVEQESDTSVTNQAWNPLIRTIEGVEMALVPAEELVSDTVLQDCLQANDLTTCEERLPMQGSFWMDVYEVADSEGLPVTGLTASEAVAQCEARGARLPALTEWQFAAAGPEETRYPWGDNWRYLLFKPANICGEECGLPHADDIYDDAFSQVAPVDAFPEGASWAGMYSMAGNVREWVQDDGTLLLAGGARDSRRDEATTDYVVKPDETLPSSTYGVRCVRDYRPGDLARYSP